MPYPTDRERDRPWVMRTYAGHSSAQKSNELYRGNLAKGQTGLSVAFDLPTQTGYDPDHELAKGQGDAQSRFPRSGWLEGSWGSVLVGVRGGWQSPAVPEFR